MSASKAPVSGATTYEELGEFWESQDLGERWLETRPASFEGDLRGEQRWFRVERDLSEAIREAAARRGVSAEDLLNLWPQERVQREAAGP